MFRLSRPAKTNLHCTAQAGLWSRFVFLFWTFLNFVFTPFPLFANTLILITRPVAFVEGLAMFHRQKVDIHIKRTTQLMFSFDIRFCIKRFCLLLSPIPLERKPLLFSSQFPGTKRQLLLSTCEAS